MFQLQSERLRLLALPPRELRILAKGRNELELALGLALTDFKLNTADNFLETFDKALAGFIIPLVTKHSSNYQWFTHWIMIERSTNKTIGGIGASGLPDKNGCVEIGYFIEAQSEGKGYATEAARCFASWLLEHPEVKSVFAHTLADGFASQKVLQKAGFVYAGETEEGPRWELNR